MTEFGRRFREVLDRPVDASGLAAFRIAFGILTFISSARMLKNGWVGDFFDKPHFFFKYFGFSFVGMPPWGATAQHWALLILSVFITVGFCYRPATILFTLGFAWVQLIDVTNYLNHYYLVVLLSLLLCFIPAHRCFSVDALLRPSIRTDQLPMGYTALLRFQVGVVYFFAGLAKLNSDWLLHAQPLSIWLSARTDNPLLGWLLPHRLTWFAMSWGGFLFDTTIAGFLLWKRTRPFAFVVLVVFHLATQALFPIGMFPSIMVTSALIFFSPEWPRKLFRQIETSTFSTQVPGFFPHVPRPLLFSLLGIYALIQLGFPLRCHLYGGNVHWHEQGMRFSWRVMVREKNGATQFRVVDVDSGREWYVTPKEYLTAMQAKEMSAQPDLILQLAHHVSDDLKRRGHPHVQVFADALVSLNGRPAVPLIDPKVDLSKVDDDFSPASWILPVPTSNPPALKDTWAQSSLR